MDEARFRVEYEQVSDQLFTFLVRNTGNRDSAADILQEAAYKAFRSRKSFRGESSFKTWIYRIAMNTLKNQWARAQRERDWIQTAQNMETAEAPNPEKIVSGREKATELSRVLGLLEEGYRIPFLLKHVDGFSYREISIMLDMEENAARVRVHRARSALRAFLEGGSE